MREPATVLLLGLGGVGRAFVERLLEHSAHGHTVQLAAVADSTGAVHARWTTPDRQGDLRALIRAKESGIGLAADARAMSLEQALLAVAVRAHRPPIIVDATADDTTAQLLQLRREGWRVALANKIPLTGPLDAFHAVTRGGDGARWEATVAAALPIVGATQALVDAGDRPHRFRGCLSGTLGAVSAALASGEPASRAIQAAVSTGLAEPDPRADLSGLDAGRKALILGRMAGWRLESTDVATESLVPAGLDATRLETFFARIAEVDDALQPLLHEARSTGASLRYVCEATPSGVRCRLEAVQTSDRLAAAEAGDSCVVVESDLFAAHPLTLSGRTAGPAGAAAALVADVVALARCP